MTQAMISDSIAAAVDYGAAGVALPVVDTIFEGDADDFIVTARERERLRRVQTPQCFRYERILKAHEKAIESGVKDATDDLGLAKRFSDGSVKLIEGSENNIKITTAGDMQTAATIISTLKEGG